MTDSPQKIAGGCVTLILIFAAIALIAIFREQNPIIWGTGCCIILLVIIIRKIMGEKL